MGELDLIHLNGHWRFWLKAKQTGFLMAAWKNASFLPLLFFLFLVFIHVRRVTDVQGGAAQKPGETLMARGVKPGRNTCFDWPKTLELPRS